ncbi:hypothetical protein SAMN04489745_3166 [Arthrobacter woluwensis]|uniref:Uncharacterized protein n=1 Tax=Arthrobacter woluwensis TaxID=156980 RepID=A0A1H4VFC5_9MICC|nr:hypothetical protein SAMN04489745_3166 [Arthrobacter woluwensis]
MPPCASALPIIVSAAIDVRIRVSPTGQEREHQRVTALLEHSRAGSPNQPTNSTGHYPRRRGSARPTGLRTSRTCCSSVKELRRDQRRHPRVLVPSTGNRSRMVRCFTSRRRVKDRADSALQVNKSPGRKLTKEQRVAIDHGERNHKSPPRRCQVPGSRIVIGEPGMNCTSGSPAREAADDASTPARRRTPSASAFAFSTWASSSALLAPP